MSTSLPTLGHFELICTIARWSVFWLVLWTVVCPVVCAHNHSAKFTKWFNGQTREKRLEFCSCIIGSPFSMEQQRRSAQSGRFVLPVMSIPMIWRVTRHGSSGSSSWRRDTSSVTQSKCTCRARAAHIEPRSSRITCCVRLQSIRRFTRRLVTFLLASKWWRSYQRRLWTSVWWWKWPISRGQSFTISMGTSFTGRSSCRDPC